MNFNWNYLHRAGGSSRGGGRRCWKVLWLLQLNPYLPKIATLTDFRSSRLSQSSIPVAVSIMAWKALLGLVLSLGNVSLLFAFDVYPWGKYDFKEYTDDLLDGLRENVQLKVWDSTLLKSLPSLSSSLLLKNSEGNTFELRQKGVEKALTVVPVQLDDFSAISEALQTSCALHTEGYWTYEWCHT